jgi:hypothetical protein
MRRGRPKREAKMSRDEREQLEPWAKARYILLGIAARVKSVLLAAEGRNSNAIAEELKV